MVKGLKRKKIVLEKKAEFSIDNLLWLIIAVLVSVIVLTLLFEFPILKYLKILLPDFNPPEPSGVGDLAILEIISNMEVGDMITVYPKGFPENKWFRDEIESMGGLEVRLKYKQIVFFESAENDIYKLYKNSKGVWVLENSVSYDLREVEQELKRDLCPVQVGVNQGRTVQGKIKENTIYISKEIRFVEGGSFRRLDDAEGLNGFFKVSFLRKGEKLYSFRDVKAELDGEVGLVNDAGVVDIYFDQIEKVKRKYYLGEFPSEVVLRNFDGSRILEDGLGLVCRDSLVEKKEFKVSDIIDKKNPPINGDFKGIGDLDLSKDNIPFDVIQIFITDEIDVNLKKYVFLDESYRIIVIGGYEEDKLKKVNSISLYVEMKQND